MLCIVHIFYFLLYFEQQVRYKRIHCFTFRILFFSKFFFMSWLFLDNDIVSFTVNIFHFLALVILIFLPMPLIIFYISVLDFVISTIDYVIREGGFVLSKGWFCHFLDWFFFVIYVLVIYVLWLVVDFLCRYFFYSFVISFIYLFALVFYQSMAAFTVSGFCLVFF